MGITVAVSTLSGAWVIASGRADQRVFNSSGLIHAWEFALGMVLAQRYLRDGERIWLAPLRYWLPLAIVGVVVLAALAPYGAIAELLNNPAALAVYGCCLIGVYQFCTRFRLQRIVGTMTWLASVSYEWYLVHGLVIVQLFRLVAPTVLTAKLFVAATSILISLCAAIGFRQFLALLQRSLPWVGRLVPAPRPL
jgi:peptidoglycan/LPS O-acetylase OafA/YrhL